MASNGQAVTYVGVCAAMKFLHDKTDVVFVLVALGTAEERTEHEIS